PAAATCATGASSSSSERMSTSSSPCSPASVLASSSASSSASTSTSTSSTSSATTSSSKSSSRSTSTSRSRSTSSTSAGLGSAFLLCWDFASALTAAERLACLAAVAVFFVEVDFLVSERVFFLGADSESATTAVTVSGADSLAAVVVLALVFFTGDAVRRLLDPRDRLGGPAESAAVTTTVTPSLLKFRRNAAA